MLIYNVTLNVSKYLTASWLQWLKNEHAPEMLKTGCFGHYRICRLLNQDDPDGETFVVQYELPNQAAYDRYMQEFAGPMQQKSKERFGDQVVAFRTLMEVL